MDEELLELENEIKNLKEWKSGVVKALWVLFSGIVGILGWILSEALAKI